MEAYPREYVDHNLPFIVLSGLGHQNDAAQQPPTTTARQETGTKIVASSPECEGERAQQLLQQFLLYDGRDQPWNATSLPGPSGILRYSVKAIGRTYWLPPRKAAPLPQSPSGEGFELHHTSPPRTTELYSTLSPLSPGSPIFPDGLFTSHWFTKHQDQVPALFIAFFDISAGAESGQDERIKADINAMRLALSRSGYKTRFATVLLSDESILRAPALEERLASIRRATTLDSKTGLFFMPPMSSQGEKATFVRSVLSPMQPVCIEYYRDLTKHARRKKARGGPAPSVTSPFGTGSQALSTLGWDVRYETKQGVFAEFRQEMDVAERHYSAAIEELFHAEGVLETTPSWSPRWDDARLVCDSLALRVLRCELWNGLTTGAAQSWTNYKVRMKDLVNRRGKGSQTYSWDAWEARWAEIMAQLIHRAQIKALETAANQPNEPPDATAEIVFASPEKSIVPSERLIPFHSLHHPGYWQRLSTKSLRSRRRRALTIPDEDRLPPGQSPASAVAKRTTTYDCYLVSDPHEEYPLPRNEGRDHIVDIARSAADTMREFGMRGQSRAVELAKMDLALDFIETGQWQNAIQGLTPLWEESSWREEDWYDIFAKLLLVLHRCAVQLKSAELIVGTTYELLSMNAALIENVQLDLAHAHAGVETETPRPIQLKYHDKQRLSPFSASFAFTNKQTHVGELLSCQLIIASRATAKASPITLSSVSINIGTSRSVNISHAANTTGPVGRASVVDLSDSAKAADESFQTEADLRICSGQIRVYSFQLLFREPNIFRVGQISIRTDAGIAEIEHTFTDQDMLISDSCFSLQDGELHRHYLPHAETIAVTVLPKPPRVQIQPRGLRKQYYADELVKLEIEILNAEVEGVQGTIKAHVQGEVEFVPTIKLIAADDADEDIGNLDAVAEHRLDLLEAGASKKIILIMKAPHEPCTAVVNVETDYSLASDQSTALHKTLALEISFAVAFKAEFSFGSLLYPKPWPTYFDPTSIGSKEAPGGIPQLWCLNSQLQSLAQEALFVHNVELAIDRIAGESRASARSEETFDRGAVKAGGVVRWQSELFTQKYTLDDRRSTIVDSTLVVSWSREEAGPLALTKLLVPRLTLPASEPRVLCTMADETPQGADALLRYYIENPSTHFLTFALTMEASDDFAFSGSKFRTLSLAPLSRHRVEYRISLHDRDVAGKGEEGGSWVSPTLQVVDSYFNKQLRVHAGGAGVKTDELGNVAVWVEHE